VVEHAAILPPPRVPFASGQMRSLRDEALWTLWVFWHTLLWLIQHYAYIALA